MEKQIYVNMSVKNVNRTRDFFASLGFSFNEQFSDENALCVIISENIFIMLLAEEFFKGFIPGKKISNSAESAEALIGINAESRERVDEMIGKVLAAGGKEYREAQDHGWMYGRAFQDLDGHIWEVLYMDESKMPEEMKNKQ